MMRKRNATRERASARALPQLLTLRITLRGIEPRIWREITVPDTYSLLQLHRCIQLVFDWFDYHLFQFHVGPRVFEGPDSEMEGEDASAARLADLEPAAGSSLLYLYDMGDGWEHDIVVRTAAAIPRGDIGDTVASLVDGARAAPPEDVGGPTGYERLLAALARPASGDDVDLIAWTGEDYDPELFDRRAGNHALVLATAWGVI
jgi:hypothetical protein